MTTLPTPQEMHAAMANRDESFAGIFFIAVKTTGIFCRPGCPARTPLPQNVEYFANTSEALNAGYRPCLRCKPMAEKPDSPEWLTTLLAKIEEQPATRITDKDLRQMGLEPATVRRAFLGRFGMTFQAYCRKVRMSMALPKLRAGEGVFETAIEHGYESDSGFRAAFSSLFGTPASAASEIKTLYAKMIESPLGVMIAVADDTALCLLEFHDRRALQAELAWVQRTFRTAIIPGTNLILEETERQLAEYFRGERQEFDLPLHVQGSEFQKRCWQQLLAIPYGQTRSYGDIAHLVGSPRAVRAVGTANGSNRLAVVIPCHRVIASDGSPAGYGGGIWRKLRLLELESLSRK